MSAGTTYTTMQGPFGPIFLARNAEGLVRIWFESTGKRYRPASDWRSDAGPLRDATEQLSAYFKGELRVFDLPLAPEGTAFQKDVWRALIDVPYGATTTYGEIAARVGRANSARAVGAANGSNPLPIVVPCHRVIGSDGSLTGYGGGMKIKEALLRLERAPGFALTP